MPTSGAALETLYDAHAGAVFAFVYNLTRNLADTQDILQELFQKLAHQGLPAQPLNHPRAYLLKLAHHLTMDQARSRQRRTDRHEALAGMAPDLFAPSSDPDEAAFRTALTVALSGLPEAQRVVVHLKLWEEMTFEGIAEVLGIPPNTAASRYRYGLEKLRAELEPLYKEILPS